MTKSELNDCFTANYKYLKNISYKVRQYKSDILLSNLYIHLDKFKSNINNEDDLKKFSNQFINKLKIWNNVSPDLSEQIRPYNRDKEKFVDDYPEVESNYNYSDIDEDLELFKENFIQVISKEEQILFNNYFEHKLETIYDIMKFYNQKITYGYKIFNQQKTILENFKKYIKNNERVFLLHIRRV
jgi:hypothetical protein